MKHLKHLCHSNKKSYLSCWQNQTMKKRILQLKEPEGSICTLTSTVTGRHLWPQHNFQKVIRHKHSPLGVLKLSFHTEIFVNTEETFWSDWHNRTLDRKSVSEILKKVLCFQTEWKTDKEKVHRLVCVDACSQNF